MDNFNIKKPLNRDEDIYKHIDRCLAKGEHLYDSEIKLIYIEVSYLGCFKKKMPASRYNKSRFWKFFGKVN